MTFGEFQTGVNRTWQVNVEAGQWEKEVLLAELGISGESGEVSELIKKGVFHKVPGLLTPEKMAKELGDLLYYTAKMADLFGLDLEEIAVMNQDKLKARYPNGFVPGGGIRTGEGSA